MPYRFKKEIDVVTAMYSKLSDLPIELMRPALKSVSTLIHGPYPDISNQRLQLRNGCRDAFYFIWKVIIKVIGIIIGGL